MAGGLTCAANGPGLEVAANGGGFPANSRLDEPRTVAEIPHERRTRTSRGRRMCSISAKADLFVWSSLLSWCTQGSQERGTRKRGNEELLSGTLYLQHRTEIAGDRNTH